MNLKAMKGSVLAAALMLALGACTNETRSDVAAEETVRAERTQTPRRDVTRDATTEKRVTPAPAVPVADRDLDVDVDVDGDVDVDDTSAGAAVTGVQACDDYLSTYRACHRVIGAYEAGDIERRYNSLRSSLIERSLDPAQHEALGSNCTSLATTMKETLDGRDCDVAPAPVADTEVVDDEE